MPRWSRLQIYAVGFIYLFNFKLIFNNITSTYFLFNFSPRFELPAPTENANQNTNKVKAVLVCHYCNEYGHKAMYCLKMTPEQRAEQARIENEPFFKVIFLTSSS